MNRLPSNRTLLAAALALLAGCGLFPTSNKDPFKDAQVLASIYESNAATSTPTNTTGLSGAFTTFSNRPVQFSINGFAGDLTKVEVVREINGVSTTCLNLDKDGNVRSSFPDWAGASTKYTLNATHEDGATKSFGPFDVTVTSANTLVHEAHGFTDQSKDDITIGGSFVQTRETQIGFGGYTGINYNSVLAEGDPRLIDFAVLTTGGSLKAVSPDDLKSIATFDRLKNDCGFQTTRFAAYTGALDPENTTARPMTPADVTSLPDPAATGTHFTLTAGAKFVYRTSDGKKGLVKVVSLGTPATSVSLAVSAVQ